MKRNVFRLITVCAMVALLCGATLCFSLPSAAENLLTDNWVAMAAEQASLVSYSNGTLTLDASAGTDVKASQTLNLSAGSYRFSATKSGEPAPDLMVRTASGDVPEGKYEEAGHVDFTLAAAGEVTLIVSEYRGGIGTLTDLSLTGSGSSETTQGGQVVTEPVVTQPQGGSELSGNWVAMAAEQASLVSYSNGTLTLDASGGTDVKASQTLNLGAGSYRFSATKSGEPAPDLMVRTASGDVPEGKYEEAGHVDFTLAAAGEVTLIVSEYRGGIGTLTDLSLTGSGSSESTPSESTPSSSETTPSETQPSQQGGSSELSGNWVAMDAGQASLVSYSNGTLTLDASAGTDVKASQTLNLGAGSYRFSATKSGEPAPDLMVRTSAGDVPEGKYEEAGHVDFTLAAAGEVTLIVSEYRGGIGTLTNISLTGNGDPIVTEPSETTPSATTPSETQPSQQGGSSELSGNWVAMDAGQASLVSFSNGTLTLDASGGVDVKASQTLNLGAGSYRFSATKSGEPSPDLMVRTAAGDVPEGKYEEAGHVDFTLAAAGEVTLIVSEYRGGIGTLTNISLTGGSAPIVTDPSSIVTDPSTVVTDPSTPSGGTNLIVNGAFNNGISGWTLSNLDENSAKVVNGQLVINMPGAWHASMLASINGTIKPNTQYTLKYEASGVTNLQVAIHLAPGFGGGATMIAQPGETTFTTAADLTPSDFYVQIEGIADGDVAGTFDNFVLVEGTNTDVTEPSVNPTQPGTNPTSVNPGQTGKVVVWSGTIARDFTTKNTVAIINVDELTQALRSDLAANGVPAKYEIEAVASYTSGPSGYACWGFYQDAPYLEAWSDKGSTLDSSVFTNAADLAKLTNSASVCLFSEGTGDITNVQSLTLYAYREGGSNPTEPIVTDPSEPIVTDPSEPIVTDPTEPIVTDPSEPIVTDPTEPTDGKVLVWAGNLNADYTTVNGVAPINDQGMMMAVIGELMTNGVPEQVEVKSALTYLGGDSGFAAIGLYSNGQVIWPDDGCPIDDVTFSNLQGLGADTALVVFSYGADTVHIDNMEIYVKRAQPVVTEPSATGSEEVNPGDANGDGAINMKDVLALRKLLADMPVGDFNEANADVNGDGSVNMKDVLALRKMLAN